MWDTYSLLDVGPTAEGEIIEPMTKNLLDAGKWLKYAGDCVYGTVCLFIPKHLLLCLTTFILAGLLVPGFTIHNI